MYFRFLSGGPSLRSGSDGRPPFNGALDRGLEARGVGLGTAIGAMAINETQVDDAVIILFAADKALRETYRRRPPGRWGEKSNSDRPSQAEGSRQRARDDRRSHDSTD